MQRRLPTLNLTALLAIAALGELVFYRVLNTAFLPAQPGTLAQRCLVGFGFFVSNFSGILALALVVLGLIRALGEDRVFPRAMRYTVTAIGLFFSVLAAMGVLWLLVTPRYYIHLRISHGFLVLFLMLGVWHGAQSLRAKVAVTLFSLPMVLDAVAVFSYRMAWTRPDPGQILRFAHTLTWAAMCAAPILLAPRMRKSSHMVIPLVSAVVLGSGLGALTALRFDLVQAVAFYGLHVDLTGLGSSAERLYTGALVVAFACLGAATISCLAVRGPSRLVGWGLWLLAVSGQDLSSPKVALFSLCALLALVMGSARMELPLAVSGAQPYPRPDPDRGAGTQNQIGKR